MKVKVNILLLGVNFGADSYGQTRRNPVLQSSITKIPYRGLGFNVTSCQ